MYARDQIFFDKRKIIIDIDTSLIQTHDFDGEIDFGKILVTKRWSLGTILILNVL